MKIKKIIKKIKKCGKKLKRRFSGNENEKCNEYHEKYIDKYQADAPQAEAVQPLPFISVFASVRFQKDRKSAFLMAGNDISKINSDACTPRCPPPENAAIDASVKIEVKNQDSF